MKLVPVVHKSPPFLSLAGGSAPDSPGTVKGGLANTPHPSTPSVWYEQQEKLLKQWGETASANRWMHYRTHLMYVKMTMWFTLPVIILSSLTGTMNFAQSSFPTRFQNTIPLMIGAVNLIMGIITTIGSFLRVSELAEGNRVAALSYGKLASNIRVEMLLPGSERTMSGSDFISLCRAEMDRLSEQTPDIPRKIEREFLDVFKGLIAKGDAAFYTPELLQLRPVEIYSAKKEPKHAQHSRTTGDLDVSKAAAKARGEPKKWPPVVTTTGSTKSVPPAPAVPEPLATAEFLDHDELASLKKGGYVTNAVLRSREAYGLKSTAPVKTIESRVHHHPVHVRTASKLHAAVAVTDIEVAAAPPDTEVAPPPPPPVPVPAREPASSRTEKINTDDDEAADDTARGVAQFFL